MILYLFGLLFFYVVWWFAREVFWYPQNRWVVWYPPKTLSDGYHHEAAWSYPQDYCWCKNYAAIFNGKVYRVR